MTSLSFMIRYSSPSILTSIGMSLPDSSRPPGPMAMISPSCGFSLAVSGMMMPAAVLASASMRLTTTRSWSGRNFMGVSSGVKVIRRGLMRSPARIAPGQRVFGAFVQAAYSVAAAPLPSDLQRGPQKKFGWEFLDRETDCVRGASKSSVPDGLPLPPASGGKNLGLARGRDQLRRGAIIKRLHWELHSACQNLQKNRLNIF